MPKFNMYQSLHTTVIGPEGLPLEIQIRTREMHEMAEFGVAAHWIYKQTRRRRTGGRRRRPTATQKLKWLRSMLDWQQELQDPKEFMETLKVDLFDEEVFVFTPKGEVKSLASGATPLDFAYEVHTEIGHRCVGARVNGKIVPLHYELRSGDIVEILTANKDRGPSRDWLSVVKTTRARNKIKQWFKAESREDTEHTGRVLLQEQLNKRGLPAQKISGSPLLADVIREMGFRKAEEFYIALGGAKISSKVVVNKILHRLKQGEAAEGEQTTVEDLVSTRRERRQPTRSQRPVRHPRRGRRGRHAPPGQVLPPGAGRPDRGYISLGRGITIHREDCPNVGVAAQGPRALRRRRVGGRARDRLQGRDRGRRLRPHAAARGAVAHVRRDGINIVEARCVVTPPMVKNRFVVEVGDTQTLKTTISSCATSTRSSTRTASPRPAPSRPARSSGRSRRPSRTSSTAGRARTPRA
jgi:GTP pyrophosphokinase